MTTQPTLHMDPTPNISEKRKLAILSLAQELVRTATQADHDSPDRALDIVGDAMRQSGLRPIIIKGKRHEYVGIAAVVEGKPGPIYWLNACLDTARVGNPDSWDADPFSGVVREGWLYGRGSADSKGSVAVFLSIASALASMRESIHGTLVVVFDLDEHTGRFGGIRECLRCCKRPDGVYIGYPGNRELKIGARGFYRASVDFFASGAHSGSTLAPRFDAIDKAIAFIRGLRGQRLPRREPGFGLGPRLTITGVFGGSSKSFSTVPDHCRVNIDVRLTPSCGRDWAEGLVKEKVGEVEKMYPGSSVPRFSRREGWPAYRLAADVPLVAALREAIDACPGIEAKLSVAGPSNAGNFLYTNGIPATCGYGAAYRGVHGPNECIEVDGLARMACVYEGALRKLFRVEG